MGFIKGALDGFAQEKALAAQSGQAYVNSALADNAAADALQRGEQKVAQVAAEGNQRVSAQKVAYANAGVDTSSGTPAKVISQTAMIAQLEELTQRNNAARAAYGYKVQAVQLRQQAEDLSQASQSAGADAGVGLAIGGATSGFGS
jgi:hypothetical protein